MKGRSNVWGIVCVIMAVMMSPDARAAYGRADVDTARIRYGGFAHAMLMQHEANFAKFTSVGFCCPEPFGTTSGLGINVGGMAQFGLFGPLQLDIRLGLGLMAPQFSQIEQTTFNDPDNNTAIPGSFEYSIATSITGLGLSVMPTYRPFGPLGIHAGLRADYLIGADFEQSERIVSPTDFIFTETGRATRNEVSGTIPGVDRLQLTALAGVSYEIPLNANGTIMIAPEAFVAYGLTQYSSSLQDNGTWKSLALQAGVSMRFSPSATVAPDVIVKCLPCEERRPTASGIDTCAPMVECPPGFRYEQSATGSCECLPAQDTVVVSGVIAGMRDGRKLDALSAGIMVDEYRTVTFVPLLPYVFFPKGRADRPSGITLSGSREEGASRLTQAGNGVQPTYRALLDIIGSRLLAAPKSSVITLVPNVGYEGTAEDVARATEQAANVKEYLTKIRQVGSDRITIASARMMPSKPTTVDGATSSPRALEENMRVEIESNDPDILLPYERASDIRSIDPKTIVPTVNVTWRTAKPSTLTVVANAPEEGGASWFDHNGDLSTRSHTSRSESYAVTIDVDSANAAHPEYLDKQVANGRAITLRAGVQFSNGVEINATELSIPITVRTAEDRRSRGMVDTVTTIYDLILFDFNSADLTPLNAKIMEKIRASITPGSKVVVSGYTDDIGATDANIALSRSRAESVARSLRELAPVEVVAFGESRPFVPNDSPWGRFYNRAVRVTIRTPVGP